MTPPRRPSKVGNKTSRILRPPAQTRKADRLPTPLDRKQQDLHEKAEQLKRDAEQLKKLIKEAPRIKEEQARRQEEELRRRREMLASETRLPARPAILDKRFDVSVNMDSMLGRRPLRLEKRDNRIYFVFLCVVFLGLLIWLIQTAWDYISHC